MAVIIVTGTPGTGKSTIAKLLQKNLDAKLIRGNFFIAKHNLSSGYDKKRKSKIVDTRKFGSVLTKELNQLWKDKNSRNIIIDSHLSHYLSPKMVDLCIVTKCDLKPLEKRLNKRRYSKSKIRENLDAEIFDVCLVEATERKQKVIVVDTSTIAKRNKAVKKALVTINKNPKK